MRCKSHWEALGAVRYPGGLDPTKGASELSCAVLESPLGAPYGSAFPIINTTYHNLIYNLKYT
jgi:hypothetical protein